MNKGQSEIRKRQRPKASNGSNKPTVVGVGASAGGLAALKRLFEHVPPDSGLSFVVVVHLSPEHKSHLADLLQPAVRFPVQQVTETTLLEPNNVYVIPPNANISTIDTHLRLTKLEEQRRERAPIDHFFRTLASTHDGHSVGVILTGTGSDGTLGLKEIKAKGGLIVVQDPNEAEFDGMPQSAIATGQVDLVLRVADIPEALLRYVGTQPRVPLVQEGKDTEHAERVLLPKVFAILRARTERDFSRYKPATILRRIARRMQLNYIEDLEAYIEKMREHPEEARALADDLLITVTSFFRDPEVFEKLEKTIVPSLFAGKGSQDSLRVWSVGCATGEEAYSLAMLMMEEASRREFAPQIQVFASDLHKRSLDSARDGIYPGDIATDVSPERLKRFFQRENGGYRIRKEVRDLVVFAPHNLLGDPPFSRIHLISCRNLLIYLERSVQRDVVDLFHYALCTDGCLLLGSSETIETSELFRTEDKRLCLYRKRNVPGPEPRLPVFPLTRMRIETDMAMRSGQAQAAVQYQALHQGLLEQYAPPSILIGPDDKLVHVSEHAGRYLIHPGGEVTSSVLKIAREELRLELRTLLQTARSTKAAADSRPVSVRFNDHPVPVVMHVRPAQDLERDGFVLIIFDEHSPSVIDGSLAIVDPATAIGHEAQRIAELDVELNIAHQRLQAIIEEYETSREEMKAANEEMQSSNEELRSTMEELETSKEELQSINEELQTVNQENRHKVEELSQLSSDLQNLLAATEIATLFLDRDLRILRFTPRVAELFNVRVTDRGRPISDLTHRLGYEQLRSDAEIVLSRLIPSEREIQDDAGRWYLTRVLPYRSVEDRIEGVVITFIDITTQKRAEFALRTGEEQLAVELDVMQKLHDLVSRFLANPDGKNALQDILDSIIDITHAHMGTVQLFDSAFERMLIVAQRGFGPGSLDHVRALSADSSSPLGEALTRNRRVIYEDVSEMPSFAPHLEAARSAGYRAMQSTPLVSANSRVIGVLSTFYSKPRKFSDREIRILDLYTHQASGFVDRLQVADELKRSDERSRSALEIDTVGVIFFTSRGVIKWANQAFLRLTGYGKEEISAGLLDLDAVAPERIVPGSLSDIEEYRSTGRIQPREREYIRKNRSRWFGLSAGKQLTADEGVQFVIDITDRKLAEEAVAERERMFNAIANLVPDLLWRSEPDGQTTWANQRWFDYTGKAPQATDVLQWVEAIHPDDREQSRSHYSEAITAGNSFRREHRLLGADGNYRWFLVQIAPYYDEEGLLVWFFGAATDIHEERMATEALRKSVAEKQELLKEIHHRVKNNLQVIISLLNLQSRQIRDGKTLAYFEEARNRIQSIASIHELIYRSESFSAVEFGDYARRLVPGVVRLYGAEDRIAVNILGDGLVIEMQRAVPLGLLLNELVSNVCKHAFPTGAPGELTVQIAQPDSQIALTVSDTGIGLPTHFDHEKAPSLGISLIRNLARQLDAIVTFVSGQGTAVTVSLPREPQQEGERRWSAEESKDGRKY